MSNRNQYQDKILEHLNNVIDELDAGIEDVEDLMVIEHLLILTQDDLQLWIDAVSVENETNDG